MSVQLTPGFTGSIEIKSPKGTTLFQQEYFSPNEREAFIQKYGRSKPTWGSVYRCVCPLRTDTLKNLSKDLFLPSFINGALLIDNLAVKIIVSIICIFIDVMTFPIRLVVTPLRAIYNCDYPEAKHPLTQLIEKKNSTKSIHDETLTIQYREETVEIFPRKTPLFLEATKDTISGVVSVAVKTPPISLASRQQKSETCLYMETEENGEWRPQGNSSIEGSSSSMGI